jgi:hypothetical protein
VKKVLLIGDSISMGYLPFVQDALKNKATVHRPDVNCESTLQGLQQVGTWLGGTRWDVIHFNWGLHDMIRNRTATRDAAVIAQGSPQVPLLDYEKNLRTLVRRLRKTGAKLVWATTTPVPPGCMFRACGEDKAYNDVALKVMTEEHVAVNDLNATVASRLSELQDAGDAHFNDRGSEALGNAVASSIMAHLNAD